MSRQNTCVRQKDLSKQKINKRKQKKNLLL